MRVVFSGSRLPLAYRLVPHSALGSLKEEAFFNSDCIWLKMNHLFFNSDQEAFIL